jgi:DNA-binding transcriptional LysR family regulator
VASSFGSIEPISRLLWHLTPKRSPRRGGPAFPCAVAPLLTGIEKAAQEAAGASATVRGRLRLNLDPWFARIVLAPRLPELTTRYPQLSLELLVSNHASPSYLARRGTPKVPKDIANHEALLFRDPQSGRPFSWEFHRREKIVEIPVDGRIVMDDPSAALAASEAGQGLFQSFELGLAQWPASGKLVQILPEWSDERFPLYAYYPSRRHVPAKLRAFLEFIHLIAANA